MEDLDLMDLDIMDLDLMDLCLDHILVDLCLDQCMGQDSAQDLIIMEDMDIEGVDLDAVVIYSKTINNEEFNF